MFAGVVFALRRAGYRWAILGFLLSGFGYVSGIGAEQSGTAIRGIVLSSSLIPAMIFGMGVAALCFYPITKNTTNRCRRNLLTVAVRPVINEKEQVIYLKNFVI